MDDLVVKLRELIDTNPAEAARMHVQALAILDETDRLIAATMPNAKHLAPYIQQNFDTARNMRRSWQITNKIMPEKTVNLLDFYFILKIANLEFSLKSTAYLNKKSGVNKFKSVCCLHYLYQSIILV